MNALPAGTNGHPAPISEDQRKASGQQTKVLVADDSAISRKLVELTLSDKQFSLIFAKSGRETLRLFAEHHPDLVIIDWTMPDLTGVEICRHIRSRPRESFTYIILLTGRSEKQNVVKGLAAGADDYLTKPFHHPELIARVGVGLRIIELQREVKAQNILLKELALTDALTGLPNRRAVEDWATRQLSGAARYGFPFWVALADLDYFKAVNDAHGHDAGDTVLKAFSQILKSHSRRSDICGRIGGEEFLLVLTHATEENATRVIDRVRAEIEATQFNFDGNTLKVTASFGLAGFAGASAPDFNRLVAQADAALYLAKRQGRNRLELATENREAAPG
jgi:diguanylate cyclase (GGDEF)-like protein